MKRIASTLLLLALTLMVCAQPEEARYNYKNKTITRNADGSTDVNVSFSLTLFTHTAMNATYGQTYVIYNPKFQTITINEAYTIQKSGKKVPLPERAVSDVLPSWAAKAVDFNYLKEKVIVHTGLDIGCTIYLDYTIHSAAGFNKNLDFTEEYDALSPITKLCYKVIVPEEMPMKCIMFSAEGFLRPTQDEKKDGQRIVTYERENIPARSQDAFQIRSLVKKCRFYTTASNYEKELQSMFYGDIDEGIRAWADEVNRTEPDGKKRYERIRRYVTDEFAVVPVPLSATDGLRPMSEIRKGAYITPYEQAALLDQMFRACNIRSEVRGSWDETMPADFRTLYNAKAFYVAENFGDSEKVLNPSKSEGSVSPTMMAGIRYEKVKPDNGKEISKEYELEVKKSDFNGKSYYVLELPANRDGVAGWGMELLPTDREVPFEVPTLMEEIETYNIKVEGGIKMAKDVSMSVSDPATSVAMVENTEKTEDGTIKIVRRISIPQRRFSPLEYPSVRSVIMTWLDANRRRILFLAD